MKERGKRTSRKQIRKYRRKQNIIKTVRGLIIFVIISILGYMAYSMYQEIKVRTVEEGSTDSLQLEGISESETVLKSEGKSEEKTTEQESFVPVVAEYEGYAVDCRLEVPEINLQTNVLTDYTKSGLKICASKYYGPNANEVGNYCIAGHNYNQENMFNHLIDLKIGDSIFLTDNTNGKVEYVIYDIYKVKPENVEPLSQKTRGEKEITLITCVNYSTKRLIVKAIEKYL